MSNATDGSSEQLPAASEMAYGADEVLSPVQEDEVAEPTAQPNEGWAVLRELIETVVLALVIFLVIRIGIQNYRIESFSMQPNFDEGQFVLVNKLAYRIGKPSRGDVVVFHNPNNEDEDYIKRVIGLPGDTVTFRNNLVYINDEPLDEPFVRAPTHPLPGYPDTFIVSPDHIFVMGDNRPNSRDGRVFGPLSEELVVGKAWLRIWPFDVMGAVEHFSLEPGSATVIE